jgi:hypothetical protein
VDSFDKVEYLVARKPSPVCKPSERSPGRSEDDMLIENFSKDIGVSSFGIVCLLRANCRLQYVLFFLAIAIVGENAYGERWKISDYLLFI